MAMQHCWQVSDMSRECSTHKDPAFSTLMYEPSAGEKHRDPNCACA